MHIPDGFISPKMYLPAYAVTAGLWAYGLRRARRTLDREAIPLLAVLTAAAFVLMMVSVPLPGGTSAHASGVALLAVTFGVWTTFLSVSMVLLLQSLLFGVGGVTSLPINAIAMAFVGSVTAFVVFSAARRWSERAALFMAGWMSVVIPAFLIALALGAQPGLAHTHDGKPLFFPFGYGITVPAVVLPHLIVGVGEGIITVVAYGLVGKLRRTAS
jgi:cobalt/nickel transport system permease protein